MEKKELTADFAQEKTEILCQEEFTSRRFCLNTLRPPHLWQEPLTLLGSNMIAST